MTSALRRYSLINARIQNYVALADCTGWTLNSGASCSSLMELTAFKAAFASSDAALVNGNLLKDLGRQITVYDATTTGVVGSPHVAVFRQVMLLNGADQEGIPPSGSPAIFYICVWLDNKTSYIPGSGNLDSRGFQMAAVARCG